MVDYLTIKRDKWTFKIRATSIKWDAQINAIATPILGAQGSSYNYPGRGGELLVIEFIARDTEIARLKSFRFAQLPFTLVSKSKMEYNGKYNILSLTIDQEDPKYPNLFKGEMQLQEYLKYNVTRQKFVNYNIKIGNPSWINVGAKFDPQTK
jgi:hypothetical protein